MSSFDATATMSRMRWASTAGFGVVLFCTAAVVSWWLPRDVIRVPRSLDLGDVQPGIPAHGTLQVVNTSEEVVRCIGSGFT